MALEEWSHFLKLEPRCETARKDGEDKTEKEHMPYLLSLPSCVCACVFAKLACGPVTTEMMDDGMCTHNLLTLRPLR